MISRTIISWWNLSRWTIYFQVFFYFLLQFENQQPFEFQNLQTCISKFFLWIVSMKNEKCGDLNYINGIGCEYWSYIQLHFSWIAWLICFLLIAFTIFSRILKIFVLLSWPICQQFHVNRITPYSVRVWSIFNIVLLTFLSCCSIWRGRFGSALELYKEMFDHSIWLNARSH